MLNKEQAAAALQEYLEQHDRTARVYKLEREDRQTFIFSALNGKDEKRGYFVFKDDGDVMPTP